MASTTYKPPPLPPPFTHSTPPPLLLAQGAEARIYKTTFLDSSTPAALKVRPTKPYRHEILDRRLTRQRVLQEARCLAKLCREGVRVPAVLAVDWEGPNNNEGTRSVGAWLLMEWIDGSPVRMVLARWEAWMKKIQQQNPADLKDLQMAGEERVKDLMRRIGGAIGSMHKTGVIHGDLTTSNLILRPYHTPAGQEPDQFLDRSVVSDVIESPSMVGEVVLIDFGLAVQSVQDEDRAVDLYVLERAFGSTHPRTEAFFDEILRAYQPSFKGSNGVLKKLEEVRMRGRKRSMLG